LVRGKVPTSCLNQSYSYRFIKTSYFLLNSVGLAPDPVIISPNVDGKTLVHVNHCRNSISEDAFLGDNSMAIYRKLALAAGSLTLASMVLGLPVRTEANPLGAAADAADAAEIDLDAIEAELEAEVEAAVEEATPDVISEDMPVEADVTVEEAEAAVEEATPEVVSEDMPVETEVESTVQDAVPEAAVEAAPKPLEAEMEAPADVEAIVEEEVDPEAAAEEVLPGADAETEVDDATSDAKTTLDETLVEPAAEATSGS
jgi:hypothetical protein